MERLDKAKECESEKNKSSEYEIWDALDAVCDAAWINKEIRTMELIDKQKLLDRAYAIFNEYTTGGGLETLMQEIESGTFDDHSTQEEIRTMELIDKQLDEIVKQYVIAPIGEADRKLKMTVLSLVSDLRNARGDLHSAQEEIAKLKEDFEELQKYAAELRIEIDGLEFRLVQAEQERDEQEALKRETYRNLAQWQEAHDALLEVLKWYADETNYEMAETRINAYSTETTSATWQDSGKRARSVVAKIEGSKPDDIQG